ncbi:MULTISPECIES: uracil-DNA glycosylase [Thalassospira]|uniref:Type-5 uracil-DNA glycosylase n=2 Tax=Thalassospira TaxID=168934 RepID=A0A367W6W2_9PROT|nr:MULTISPECIES: uracil-DNA glycosylase [Thalassospira]MDG4719605.1 uracil-DNA glycosylase [Thalassospira sp. FZY0004]RCK36351.1 uracil-DNA glycosylase [Thalassospira profundimaris]
MTSYQQPDIDCQLCPRLVEFRRANQEKFPQFYNGPVRPFGPINARLLIVGLAPGLKGANATGRPFTGDYAGDLLYDTLKKFGFAKGTYDKRPDDGLELLDCRITNAVKCVPPENKPTGPEANACRPFLISEFGAMENLSAILCLGQVAHQAMLRTFGLKLSSLKFAHGASHKMENGITLFDSYHCSRYNTQTYRLTPEMFENVFADIRAHLDG